MHNNIVWTFDSQVVVVTISNTVKISQWLYMYMAPVGIAEYVSIT